MITEYMRELTDKANRIWKNKDYDGAVICLCIYIDDGLANVSLELMNAEGPIRANTEAYHGQVFTDTDLLHALEQLEEFINMHNERSQQDKFMRAVMQFAKFDTDLPFRLLKSSDRKIIEDTLEEYFDKHKEALVEKKEY